MNTTISLPESKLTKKQVKTFHKSFREKGNSYRIVAEVRHDDECGNGHNIFSITGTIWQGGREVCGGCIHEEIAKHFPELAPFIKWHLTSTDAPMHYVANVIYLAGDRDYNGKRKGEVSSYDLAIKFGSFPILWRTHGMGSGRFEKWLGEMGAAAADCEVLRIDHEDRESYKFAPKYTLGGYADKWHECPFDTEDEALRFIEALKIGFEVVQIPTAWSEGKARELAAARSVAVWPEATDEQLSAEPEVLKAMLEERLPALMEAFKKDVESLGFVY